MSNLHVKSINNHLLTRLLFQKYKKLTLTVNGLKNDADKYAFEADKMNDLTILSKSNALKRAAIDKEITLGELKSKNVRLLELKEQI